MRGVKSWVVGGWGHAWRYFDLEILTRWTLWTRCEKLGCGWLRPCAAVLRSGNFNAVDAVNVKKLNIISAVNYPLKGTNPT